MLSYGRHYRDPHKDARWAQELLALIKKKEAQEMLREILDAREGESVEEAAQRVVAERDALIRQQVYRDVLAVLQDENVALAVIFKKTFGHLG